MTVDYPTPRWPAPASGGDEGCRRLVVAERGVSGKEAGFRVSGCVAARRARSVRGRSSAALTFPLVVVLRTYSPSRAPFEESYLEVTRGAMRVISAELSAARAVLRRPGSRAACSKSS